MSVESAAPARGGAGLLITSGRPLILLAVIVLAIALRIFATTVPSLHHPDEVFQYLEPAHRMVFGYGVVSWEFKEGIRNWLLPDMLAGPMAIGAWVAPQTRLYLWLPQALMVVLSLMVPLAGWQLGRRISPGHAVAAATIGAVWPEFVYFAPHTLSENVAGAFFLLAAIALHGGKLDSNARGLAIGGAALALAAVTRFQFAPALAVLAIASCRADISRWLSLLAGVVIGVAVGASVDVASGQIPFAWFVRNLHENLLSDRASQYGTMGALGYLTWFTHLWGWWLAALIPLIRLGAKRYPAMLWAAVANIVLHSVIAHKEYRFVELSAVIFILLAAIGSVDALAWLRERFPGSQRGLALAGCIGFWLAASVGVATGSVMRDNYARGADTLAATRSISEDSGACGIAILRDLVEWGGYSYLHRPIQISYFDANDPLLQRSRAGGLAQWSDAYNRAIAAPSQQHDLPPQFTRVRCYGQSCVFSRPGGCRSTPTSPFLLQAAFDRIDQQMRENMRNGVRPAS